MTELDTSPRLLLLGYGNVARAFLSLLASRCAWMEQESGGGPRIYGIGSRRTGFFLHPSGIPAMDIAGKADPLSLLTAQGQTSADARTFLQDGHTFGANVLIELTTLSPQDGEPALTHIRQALENGMHVITANKGPIAHAGEALQRLAQLHGVQLRFESTVMDGLPLVNLAEFTLPAVGIHGFRGLLNTTSSIVLRQVEEGQTLEEAIQLAQQLGVAEANPWHDLDGWDATMKTVILARTLLNAHLTTAQVQRTGIRELPHAEVIAAARAGTPIRLVSSASLTHGIPVATVHPERLLPSDPLFCGKDCGIVSLETDAMGTITLTQHAINVQQTAYGVLSDLIIIQRTCQKPPANAVHDSL